MTLAGVAAVRERRRVLGCAAPLPDLRLRRIGPASAQLRPSGIFQNLSSSSMIGLLFRNWRGERKTAPRYFLDEMTCLIITKTVLLNLGEPL